MVHRSKQWQAEADSAGSSLEAFEPVCQAIRQVAHNLGAIFDEWTNVCGVVAH